METETKPPTRMSKVELYAALSAAGYTEEQLADDQGKKLKQPILREMYQSHRQGEEGLAVLSKVEEDDDDDDDVGIEVKPDTKGEGENKTIVQTADVVIPYEMVSQVDGETDESELDEPDLPTVNDPGWTQYVLGKFQEDEVDGKNPRVEGLRRVAGELVGELVEEGCDLVAVPSEDNAFRACTKAWGVFVTPEGRTKRFEALADAHSDNCHEDYATYLVAMADTRAKGRMFRNALHLRRVVSAEEVNKTMASTADTQAGGPIHAGQISMISLIAERHGFKIADVLDGLGIEYKINEQTGDVNLQSLRYEDALAAAKKMREMKEAWVLPKIL